MAYVYILKNAGGNYYIGSTIDLDKRLEHHIGNHTPSTKRLKTKELVFKQWYDSLSDARKIELKLKKLKRKDYIEKIVKEGFVKMRL